MKIIHFCLFLLLGLSACKPSSEQNNQTNATAPVDQKSADAALIMDYVKQNGLNGKTTPSGLFYAIEKQGDGPSAQNLQPASKVSAHYHGTFLDGKVFDSSVEKGTPLNFELRQVIPGWQEAIKLLNQGGKGTFLIPSHLAYGPKGYPGLIAPNTVLRFEVELLEFSE